MGESYSGPEATLIASRLGERVAGLILAVTFVAPPLPSPFRALTRWFGTGLVPLAVVERLLLNGERGDVRRLLHAAIAAVPDPVMTARAMAALSCDVRAELAAVECPVLSMEAKRDRLILGHCGRDIARVKPGRRRVVVDGPHMILETHVRECVQVIDGFCREIEEGLARV